VAKLVVLGNGRLDYHFSIVMLTGLLVLSLPKTQQRQQHDAPDVVQASPFVRSAGHMLRCRR